MSTAAKKESKKKKKPENSEDLAGLMGEDELPGALRRVGDRKRRVASLSVVLPAKNEAANLGPLLKELKTVLQQEPGLDYEILLIDDGSSDDTAAIGELAGVRVVRHAESLGNGAAVKRGIREARCDWVLMLDGDGQHPPKAIPDMIDMAEFRNYDMVVGSRNGKG